MSSCHEINHIYFQEPSSGRSSSLKRLLVKNGEYGYILFRIFKPGIGGQLAVEESRGRWAGAPTGHRLVEPWGPFKKESEGRGTLFSCFLLLTTTWLSFQCFLFLKFLCIKQNSSSKKMAYKCPAIASNSASEEEGWTFHRTFLL